MCPLRTCPHLRYLAFRRYLGAIRMYQDQTSAARNASRSYIHTVDATE